MKILVTALLCLVVSPAFAQAPPAQPPPDLLSHVNAAKELLQQGRRMEALHEFVRGGYRPTPVGIAMFYQEWGAVRASEGKYAAAIRDYRLGLHEDLATSPFIAGNLHWRLGDLLERRGRYADAATQYAAGVRLGGGNIWTRALLLHLTRAQERSGQNTAARHLWEQVLANGDAADRKLARRSLRRGTR